MYSKASIDYVLLSCDIVYNFFVHLDWVGVLKVYMHVIKKEIFSCVLGVRASADYASIISGKIGASEHQELCWKNR